jgi:hypothetical protein
VAVEASGMNEKGSFAEGDCLHVRNVFDAAVAG